MVITLIGFSIKLFSAVLQFCFSLGDFAILKRLPSVGLKCCLVLSSTEDRDVPYGDSANVS